MKRRNFIKNTALAGTAWVLPWKLQGAGLSNAKPLHFGLIAGVHQDIMHDAPKRLQVFIDAANGQKTEFIMQLGDFCVPHERNRPFMEVWEQFKGPKYHVLGNHDTDGRFNQQQAMDFWGMPSRYYSFDRAGYHFVVLDGNDANPAPWSGYHRYIHHNPQPWLQQDLENTNLPTFIFSHQTLENEDGGVANQQEVRQLLEAASFFQ